MNGYKFRIGLIGACVTTYSNGATLTVNPNPVVNFAAIDSDSCMRQCAGND